MALMLGPTRSASAERQAVGAAAPYAAAAAAAARRSTAAGGPRPAGWHRPARCLVRAAGRRGAGRRRARGAGPGRAVRGARRVAPTRRRRARVDGRPVRFRHPADAIRAGLVYVPADRLEALLPQRSVRENIALPFSAPTRRLGPHPTSAREERAGRRRHRAAPDRHPSPVRGPTAVGRQPAEGDHRPLDRDGCPDAAVLRPDARHRHPHQAPDLPAAAGAGRRRRRRAAVHLRAGGDPARLRPGRRHLRRARRGRDAGRATPTSRPCCARRTRCHPDALMPEEVAGGDASARPWRAA